MNKIEFINLINQNLINKFRLLISYYQKIFLSDEELLLIIHIFNKINFQNDFLAAFEIAKNTNFTIKKVDFLLENLMKRQYLKIVTKKETQRLAFDFNLLYTKIYDVITNNKKEFKLISNSKNKNPEFIDYDWLNN